MTEREFYPAKFGAFSPTSVPFTGTKQAFGAESSMDGGPDGDEDMTDYEEEDAPPGGLPECNMPSYKAMVLAKKKELKQQYGKGHFVKKDCGTRPLAVETIPNMPCFWNCSKEKNATKDCCTFNANQAEKRAQRRIDIQNWITCSQGANAIGWVPGWRAKWRQYKRDGNLDVLKSASRCENTGGGTPPPNTPQEQYDVMTLSCEQMRDRLGIIPGKSWGTATPEVIRAWQAKNCFGTTPEQQAQATAAANAKPAGPKKISTMMMLGAMLLGVILIGGLLMYAFTPGKQAA